MKKTVTINLSGIIFHIDEDAHDKLSNYLNKIKSYFSDSEGRDEIMADIEARIAEMFQEKISKNKKEVISIEDVEAVIAVMGKPEDYIDGQSEETGQADESTTTSQGQGSSRRKRVFRDPDNNVLGGVCSGIAAYFNFDPIWLRIAFAVAFFFFGTGFLLYLLLWIIIPEAKTTAEKLEMKGESVNVSNIEKTIKEELDKLKKKFNEFKNEARDINTKPHVERAKSVIEKIIDFIISILTFILRAFAKLIGVIFIAIGIFLVILLLSSMLGSNAILSITPGGINTFAFHELLDVFFISDRQILLATISLLLLCGLPLIALIYNGIKLLLGIKTKIKGLGFITLSLWIAGFILSGYICIQMVNDFAKNGKAINNFSIMQPAGNTLYLTVGEHDFDPENYDSRIECDDWYCFFNDGEKINFGYPKLDVVKSKTDSFEVELVFSARGKTRKKAIKRAGNINYLLTQEDSMLNFNPYYSIPDDEKWRSQNVTILVKVPENKSVYFSDDMEDIIYDIANVSGTYDHNMTGKTWTMLEDGLTCVECDEDEL